MRIYRNLAILAVFSLLICAVVVAVLAIVLGIASPGGSSVDGASVEANIMYRYRTSVGLSPAERRRGAVRCPRSIQRKRGERFYCVASHLHGRRGPWRWRVTVLNESGPLRLRIDPPERGGPISSSIG